MSRRLALIGAPLGPWVYTAAVVSPYVRITGLKGAQVTVQTREGSHTFSEDGTFPLPRTAWVQCSVAPPCRSVICEVVSRVA